VYRFVELGGPEALQWDNILHEIHHIHLSQDEDKICWALEPFGNIFVR
jgi:hypothetical protein